MHVNGLGNKFSEPNDSVMESARACLTSLFADKPCTVMPVFSSDQGVRQAHATFAGLGSTDLIVTAGGGIMADPDGPAAGRVHCARPGTPRPPECRWRSGRATAWNLTEP